jgi:hypothetical protein
MPWTPSDGPKRHTKKANTPGKRKQWSDTANAVRKRAMANGESESEADASAVRIANSAVKKHPSKKRPSK